MNILVVNPPNVPFSSRGILIEPIDALSVASWIASLGHETRFMDMDVRQTPPSRFSALAEPFHPELVLIIFDYHIPLHCDGALAGALSIAQSAKALGAKVAVAGKSATYAPDKLLFLGSGVDVLLSHEAEPALHVLLGLPDWSAPSLSTVPDATYIDPSGSLSHTARPAKPFDLSLLPIPDRRLVDLGDYIDTRTILSSRGCHMKCDFCHVPGFWGGWRGRPAASVADEIEILAKDHGAKKILFLDDNAPVGKRRMKEICRALIERKVHVAMGCLSSLDCFEPELMEAMREAGFRWIHYGVESGDDRLLSTIHKRTDAASIRRIVSQTMAMGFRVRTSWIMDLPTTTADELARTAELILETRSHEVRLHHLALRLGSKIGQEHAGVPSTQYIHQGTQNQNLCAVSPQIVADTVERVAAELGGSGYALARHPDEFLDVDALRARSPELRVVSLCPLRYGLDWTL
jgi:anaerobic magnesium-protoporphyrin IX monomethyl ester cyclase